MSEVSIRAGARFALVAALAMLSACGGGGGGDDGTTSPGTGGGGGGGGPSTPTNRAPVFGTTSFSATEDTDLSAQVTATDADGDALTFTRTGDPSSGTVTSFTAAGAFVYRPNANVNGSDSFAVRVADPVGNTVDATVTITIAAANDAPTAANDVLRADGPQLTSLDLLANDRDPDGDALTVTIEEAPLVGTAVVGSDKKFRLEGLPAGFRGLTRFRYRITDAGGAFAVATAAVFIGTDPFARCSRARPARPACPRST
jgi:VCBS repeat-containing protein